MRTALSPFALTQEPQTTVIHSPDGNKVRRGGQPLAPLTPSSAQSDLAARMGEPARPYRAPHA